MTGMSPSLCDRTRALLSERLDGAISEVERRRVARHTSTCPACRAFEERSRWLADELRAAPLEALPRPVVVSPRRGRDVSRAARWGTPPRRPRCWSSSSAASSSAPTPRWSSPTSSGSRRVPAPSTRSATRSARSASTRCEPASCRSSPRPVRRPPSSRRARSTGSASPTSGTIGLDSPTTLVGVSAEAVRTDELHEAIAVGDRLLANIETVVHGKRDEIRLVLTALACGGHVLFEDVPGTAKTILARAVSQSIEGSIGTRIQCTPDLQPTDVTGLAVYDQRTRDFEFRPGPIFANVVLVDEINRATPKTQSALLEAMAEQQVTVDGTTKAVPHPFLLLATENPIEYEGTFPLPEAQLDRFFLRTSLGYPTADEELQVIHDQRVQHPLATLGPVVSVGGDRCAGARGHRRVPRPAHRGVDRRPRPRHARDERDVGRRLGAREPRPGARGARMGAAPRARVRRARRRRTPPGRRPRSSRRADPRQARRGAAARNGERHGAVRRGVPRAGAAAGGGAR